MLPTVNCDAGKRAVLFPEQQSKQAKKTVSKVKVVTPNTP
jgi:hypothetical protein